MAAETMEFTYRFEFEGGKEKEFRISIGEKNLSLVQDGEQPKPDWTSLGFNQCKSCTLDPAVTEHCPAAVALYKPIVVFKDYLSYESAKVFVKAGPREYTSETSLQIGLSSLFGLVMATSGCPVLEKLRPMARFHLPFADEKETSYRAISMYLVAQYLRSRRGETPDWNLSGLARIYDDVIKVNSGFVERLRNMPIKDASINAIAALDCFAMGIGFAISDDMLEDMSDPFAPLLG